MSGVLNKWTLGEIVLVSGSVIILTACATRIGSYIWAWRTEKNLLTREKAERDENIAILIRALQTVLEQQSQQVRSPSLITKLPI